MSERPVIDVQIGSRARWTGSRKVRFGDVLRIRDEPHNRWPETLVQRWLYIAFDKNRDTNTLMVLTGPYRGTTMHFSSPSISGFIVVEEGPGE